MLRGLTGQMTQVVSSSSSRHFYFDIWEVVADLHLAPKGNAFEATVGRDR